MGKLKVSKVDKVFYIYLQNQLIKQALPNRSLNKVEAQSFLCRSHNIPKQVSKIMIQEMIELGLVENQSRYNIKVCKPKINPVEQTNVFYKSLKIF